MLVSWTSIFRYHEEKLGNVLHTRTRVHTLQVTHTSGKVSASLQMLNSGRTDRSCLPAAARHMLESPHTEENMEYRASEWAYYVELLAWQMGIEVVGGGCPRCTLVRATDL